MLQDLRVKTYRLLRWSEKYTKTDMVYLAKGGGWLTIGRVFSMALTLGLSLAFANLISPTVYGQYKYVISIVSLLSLFTLSGMGTAIIRSVGRGYEGTLRPALFTEMRWGILGALTAWSCGAYYGFRGDATLAISFLIAGFVLPFINVFSLSSAILQGKKLFGISVKYDTISQAAYALLALVFLFTTKDVYFLIIPYLVGSSLFQGIVLWSVVNKVTLNNKIDPEAIPYGKRLSLMKALDMAGSSLYGILVFNQLGSGALAVFSFAIAPIEQVRGYLRLAESLLLPKMALDKWEAGYFFGFVKKSALFMGVLVMGIVIYISAAPFLYGLLFPRYQESVFYTQLYALSLLPTAVSVVLGSVIKARADITGLGVLNAIDIASIFVITLPMSLYYGLTGLVLSIIAVKVIEAFYLFFRIFHNKPFSRNNAMSK